MGRERFECGSKVRRGIGYGSEERLRWGARGERGLMFGGNGGGGVGGTLGGGQERGALVRNAVGLWVGWVEVGSQNSQKALHSQYGYHQVINCNTL